MITEPDWISETYLPEVQSSCVKLKGSQEREVENAPDLQLQRRKFRSFHHRDFIQMWVHRNGNNGDGVVFWMDGWSALSLVKPLKEQLIRLLSVPRCAASSALPASRWSWAVQVPPHCGCAKSLHRQNGEIWDRRSHTYEVTAKVTACNRVAILCDRKENEVLRAVSGSDELGELHECGI